ncbi:MAG: hypothetical protein QCI00_01560 [Candidatus Thermoplasmatota archaeon]|nr:hypothetical protein [Candidatus Thermoplasmatota archaeon]
MKGITNYEIREYFETMANDIKELKQMKTRTSDTTLFFMATIAAITATVIYVFHSHPVLLFFIISGLVTMAIITIRKNRESTD